MSLTLPTPHDGAVDFTQWMFLATPLDDLCDRLGARIVTMPDMPAGFYASVYRIEGRMFVVLPDDDTHNRLECETAARAALAAWFDVDVSDWPMSMTFHESHDGETWERHDLATAVSGE